MLEIDGEVRVRCTVEAAWGLFCRFEEIAALIPTVESVTVEGEQVHARVETRLGVLPVSSRVVLTILETKPYACLKAQGLSYLGETIQTQLAKGKSLQGIESESVGRLALHLDLRESDEAGTIRICYQAGVEAEGRLKRIYQSILDRKAPAMMEAFAENLRRTLEVEAVPGGPDADDGAAAPSDAALVTRAETGRTTPAQAGGGWLRRIGRAAGDLLRRLMGRARRWLGRGATGSRS